MTGLQQRLAVTGAAYDAVAARLTAFFEAAGESVTEFDHKVAPAYRWPVDDLAALAAAAGFTEVGRMSREPDPGTRYRRGHLLLAR
jgi:hypothetical protein